MERHIGMATPIYYQAPKLRKMVDSLLAKLKRIQKTDHNGNSAMESDAVMIAILKLLRVLQWWNQCGVVADLSASPPWTFSQERYERDRRESKDEILKTW